MINAIWVVSSSNQTLLRTRRRTDKQTNSLADGRTDGRTNERTEGCMLGRTDGNTVYGWTDVQTDRYPHRQAAGYTNIISTKLFSPRLTITERFTKITSLGILMRAKMAGWLRRQTWNPEWWLWSSSRRLISTFYYFLPFNSKYGTSSSIYFSFHSFATLQHKWVNI